MALGQTHRKGDPRGSKGDLLAGGSSGWALPIRCEKMPSYSISYHSITTAHTRSFLPRGRSHGTPSCSLISPCCSGLHSHSIHVKIHCPPLFLRRDPHAGDPMTTAAAASTCNTLFVGNLSDHVSEDELLALFQTQAGYRQLKLVRGVKQVSHGVSQAPDGLEGDSEPQEDTQSMYH